MCLKINPPQAGAAAILAVRVSRRTAGNSGRHELAEGQRGLAYVMQTTHLVLQLLQNRHVGRGP